MFRVQVWQASSTVQLTSCSGKSFVLILQLPGRTAAISYYAAIVDTVARCPPSGQCHCYPPKVFQQFPNPRKHCSGDNADEPVM